MYKGYLFLKKGQGNSMYAGSSVLPTATVCVSCACVFFLDKRKRKSIISDGSSRLILSSRSRLLETLLLFHDHHHSV